MRFVWAIIAFVLATLMIGAGVAQRTILEAPATETATLTTDADAPYVLIDGAVLASHPGAQTLRIAGDGPVFAAYGRTQDIAAWLAPTEYVHVTLGAEDLPVSETVAASAPVEGDAPTAAPAGSDLWLDEFEQDGSLATTLRLPADMSVLVASDGTAAAPSELSVTWPTGATTPWAGPLLAGGILMAVVGLVLYILALRHVRRSRGPRRKGLPTTATQPIDLSVEQAEKGVITAAPARKRLGRGRRPFVALSALLVGGIALTGCSPDAWPDLQPEATPSPSASVIVPEGQGAPAVTKTQAERILGRISEQVAAADEAKDPKAAALRLTGPALTERETNYRLRTELPDADPLPAIPAGTMTALLPQAKNDWPRMFMAVVEDADGVATVMTATQSDPWAEYKVAYISSLRADATMNLAAEYVGAVAVEPTSPFLLMPPENLAAAYADVLDKGDKSEFAALFDEKTDTFRSLVAENRAAVLKKFNETGEETGRVSFQAEPGDSEPLSLVTLDSGAIVAVTVTENETAVPTDSDAVIKLGENVVVKALSGVSQSSTGFQTRYTDQLYFFVPAQGSNDKIQLLASRSNVLDAKVVEKE
ncbi:glycosyl transferase [Microbacterium sp. KSW4-11]|uniref:Glycosyl transferase n=1 Tax=Microbacterium gawkjiense TaxID=3067309 RepID=A0ABU3GCJ5_9MICO|nr:glycosyl transferase [Microbacterium sp. KSW4-11]MDT3317240.1 glycosyl transferase [Microbacterium sp. KSW4-11]